MKYRKFLKNIVVTEESDQRKGLPVPPIQKPYPEKSELIDLVSVKEISLGKKSFIDLVQARESRRKYTDEFLTLEELSFLLWCTQGVKGLIRNNLLTLRTVPSGGCMHPFETYLIINRVEGMKPGLYRYIALEHKLLPIKKNDESFGEKIGLIANRQMFVGKGAVVFIWTVRPYRTEYRYGEDSLKDILMSVGHICQNLYLACEAIDLGTCAILAYEQEKLDKLLNIDGYDEVTLYLAPVGKIEK